MPLKIVRNNILEMEVDAIVNPTDYKLSGSGSIDKKIHDAGGQQLRNECDEYEHCNFGDAVLTHAYNLPCKYIIHTVGPFWRDNPEDLEIMESCYTNCLRVAAQQKLKSIAFPLIATGSFGCPKDLAVNIAINTITSFLLNYEMKVYLVLYTADAVKVTSKLVEDIKSYISDEDVENDRRMEEYLKLHLREKRAFYEYRNIPLYPTNGTTHISKSIKPKKITNGDFYILDDCCALPQKLENISGPHSGHIPSLDDFAKNKKLLQQLDQLEDTFGSRVLKYIDMFGFSDVEVYKAACISKQLFQRIKNDENISKKTALAVLVALPLTLKQVTELLNCAGYSFSKSSKFDRCVQLIIESMEGRSTLLSINKVDYTLYELGLETFTKA